MSCIPFSLKCLTLLTLPLLLSACASEVVSFTLTATQTPHAEAYLASEGELEVISGRYTCSEEDPNACLVRLEARDRVMDGPARSLVLYVAPNAQTLPGVVDLYAVQGEPYATEPVLYTAIEDVDPDESAKRYDYTCRYAGTSGVVELEQLPTPGTLVHGRMKQLVLTCTTQLDPQTPVEATLSAVFDVLIED